MNTTDRPNILWISVEDTTPRFGCYGDPIARTPNIDRLAAGGCRFPNAFSTAGVCAPSRSAIITGMYQTSIGTHHHRTTHTHESTPDLPTPYSVVPPPYVKTFTEYLRGAGYYCTNNSKTDYQFTPPITAWDDNSNQGHWRNRSDGQPFFSVFNPIVTHESGMWEKEDRPLTTNPDDVELPPYLPNTPKARAALARQYDNLATADARVGELLDQLEADGLAENTIVFLWSDHGEGLPRGKRWPYDAGIRIPLIVRWHEVLHPGSESDQLVSLIDLGPTVLSLCGVQAPQHLHGQPFLGPEKVEREYIFATRDRLDLSYQMLRAVRDKRYKYIRNYYPEQPYLLWDPYRNDHPVMQEMWRLHTEGKLEGDQLAMFQSPRPAEELYDLENDTYELNNLAENAAHANVLKRMRETLTGWQSKFGDMGHISEEEMVAKWYPNGIQPQTASPLFIPINASNPGTVPAHEDGEWDAPLLLQLYCSTQGASIAYTTEQGEDVRWQLYTEPLRLPKGETVIRAKAIRIGYKESDEKSLKFTTLDNYKGTT
ncbi:MAG: sulfatase-like hydrolase/transferase [Candidatus Poribacteria bacterium]|nr:sulfatase-like hydrolase/transferase [Candidatus Poribacteria bacterium]